MKNKVAIFILIISSINLYSQPEDPLMNPFLYFYSENYLDAKSTGMGFAGVASTGGISSINRNPASLEIPLKYQADAQYTYKTNQPWLQYLDLNDLYLGQNLFSGSAGFGYRVNKHFQTGFLYSNPFSIRINIGPVIVTNEFGEELYRFDAYDKYIVHSFSIPVIYSNDKVRIGARINYSLHRRISIFNDSVYTGNFNRFNVQGGLIFTPVKEFSLGVTFMPEVNGIAHSSFESGLNEEETKVFIPLYFGAGFVYRVRGNFISIAGDYNFFNFSKRKSLKDRHQFRLGFEFPVNKNWIIRTGFFTSPDPRNLTAGYGNPGDNYDQIFLTAGGSYKINNFEASLGIMDSHISSGVLHNTFINGGLTFNFK